VFDVLTNERGGFMPVENGLYICLGPATGLYSTGQSLHKLKSKKSLQEDILFVCILLNNKKKRI
jgi:hypothetical protein